MPLNSSLQRQIYKLVRYIQTNLIKMSVFFKRILQIAENKGFKNVTDFSKNGLEWLSSEKLNRLRKENNKPSIDILLEISNKFDDVNLHWLITGQGQMLLNSTATNENELSRDLKALEEIVAILREKNSMQDDIISMLREKLQFTEDKLQQCQQEKNIQKATQ